MAESDEYKRTFMDRHGPDAGNMIKAIAWGIIPGFLTFFVILARSTTFWGVLGAFVGGSFMGSLGWLIGTGAGLTMARFTMGGNTTPYVEQYSYQQALVMKGQVDEALESFEAVIAEKPDSVNARVRAAELYVKERGNHARAAELFREAHRIETIQPGEYIYISNRLVDLYNGPLGDPGKALAELRKLIDRYPGSPAAQQARGALAALKARHLGSDA